MRYVVPAVVLAVVAGGVGYWVAKDQIAPAAQAENAAAAVAQTAPAAGPAADRTPSASNPKVASVGNDVILKSDVDQLYNAIKQRAGERAPEEDKIFWMLVDQIISSRLIIQAATADKLDQSAEVQNSIKMASEQILQEAYIQSALKGLDSDASLKPRYDQLVASMKDQQEVHARHILVQDEAKARELIAQINKGGDFSALAKANSIDEGSKERGGDLGFFSKDAMVPEFANVAFALNKGQVSQDPVKTQFGWHIIKVEDRRARTAPTFEQAKGQLLSELQQEKIRTTIDTLRSKGNIERFDAAGVPPQPKLPVQDALERAAAGQGATPAPAAQ